MRDETLADFVLRLKWHQVSVAVRNGDLAVSCPAGRMPEYLLAEIRARKPELLGFLNGFPVELRMAIDAVGAQPDYDVSPVQRQIWMFDQLDLSRRAYNVPGAYLLTGELDLAALQESLNALVYRHEILRTTFINRDSDIRQRIHDELAFTIPMVELSADEQSQQTIAELIRKTVETRFNLAALPLFDLRLIRLGERSTLVVFNLHHIICDGRSLELLTDELFSRYLHRDASPARAPTLRRQYKDYAAWFNRLLESGALNYQRDYWLRKLGGEAPPLRLPYDHHRPTRFSRRSRIKTIELSHEEVVRLRDLAVARRCTLFNALLTFVLLLLRCVTDDEDIRIGTPVIGRPHAELRDQIGCHINLVVLRNRIDGDVSLEALMAAVQAVTAEAFAHQLYPFELLASQLAERRTPNRNPLFDVLVALQDDRHELNDLSELALRPYPIRGDVGRYDLTFGFEVLDSRIRLHIEYLEEIFTEATAERIGSLFLKLLRTGLDSPHAKVADLAGGAAPAVLTPASVTSRGPVETPLRTGVPVSEVQNLLLEVLRDVLRAPDLDVVDNYFEHGGDSVKAMQTIARLSRSGMALAISDFFVYPTIVELSSRVRSVRRGASAGHHARTTQIGESTLDKVLNEYPSWRGRVQGVAFLSPMQEGILFQTISGGEPSTCQAQTTLTLEGRISPSVFSTVWEHLFERHDMLRTRIVPALADRPLQVTLSPSSAGEDVRYRDLRDLPVEEQERALALATLDDRQSGFTLGDAPLVRVYLFQLSETRFQVLISHQQIVLDGWSVSALLIEFAQIYDALASSRPVRLPAVSSFSSYVDWLETNTTETQRQYWQDYLADLRTPTDLPFKKARSGALIGKVHLDLGPHLSAQLASLSRERMVTLSTILQALWGVLVGKYNETDDVVFGTVVSVRPAELDGIEYALGVYMNSIPVRLRSFANQTFAELLDAVRAQSLQSWPHGHFPLAEILKSTPHRDRLFAHLLIVQNYPMSGDSTVEKRGFEAELIAVVESAGYDLVVEARPGRTIRIAFEYNQGAYERRDVEALAGHFLALTRSTAAQPDRRIAGLSLLDDEAERRLGERVAEDQATFSRIGSFDFD